MLFLSPLYRWRYWWECLGRCGFKIPSKSLDLNHCITLLPANLGTKSKVLSRSWWPCMVWSLTLSLNSCCALFPSLLLFLKYQAHSQLRALNFGGPSPWKLVFPLSVLAWLALSMNSGQVSAQMSPPQRGFLFISKKIYRFPVVT